MKHLLNTSFEFFPPKTEEGKKHLQQTVFELENVAPRFFSVTFGAGGSAQEGTLQTIKALQKNTAIPIAPHLACMGSNRSELETILKNYQAMGLKRIVALRGDLPSGKEQTGDLKFAHELVSLIRETTGDHFHIEVGAYPECHPQSKTMADELFHFKMKMDAGANSAITQYFFNVDAYFYFIDACAKNNIFKPIIPGIMPITQFAKLKRFSEVCGAEIPRWIHKRLEAYGEDTESLKAFGAEVIYRLCDQLLKGGAPGLHFYTLNQYEASKKLVEKLNIPIPLRRSLME